MAMSVGAPGDAGSITYTPMEYVFKISEPEMKENEYTVDNEDAAREIMANVGIRDFDKLNELLDGLDMTSISTRQLSALTSELRGLGFNDISASTFLGQGNQDTGFDGQSRNLDVKFNAIPLIYEQLEGHRGFALREGLTKDRAFGRILGSLVNANHVVAALTYLAKSAEKLPSINERV